MHISLSSIIIFVETIFCLFVTFVILAEVYIVRSDYGKVDKFANPLIAKKLKKILKYSIIILIASIIPVGLGISWVLIHI